MKVSSTDQEDLAELRVPVRERVERAGDVSAVGPGLAGPAVLFERRDEVQEPPLADEVVNEVATRSHPDLRRDLESEPGQAVSGHQASIRGATRESRAVFAEHQVAHGGMDPIGADDDVEACRRAVVKRHVHAIAAIGERNQPMREMHAILRQRVRKHREQIRPMHLVVGEAERLDDRVAQRCSQQGPTVIPTALVHRGRTHSDPSKLLAQTETMQNARRVRADLNPRANIAQRPCSLVQVHIDSRLQQRQGRR